VHSEFHHSYAHATEVRADIARFLETILDIADNTASDWSYNPASGKLSVNKEAVPRSKQQIETQAVTDGSPASGGTGGRQQVDLKSDFSCLLQMLPHTRPSFD